MRAASTKHPNGFEPPSQDDLIELRERVQEFTRMSSSRGTGASTDSTLGREISEDFAAKVDKENDFPEEMWQKLGEAGFLGVTVEEQHGGLAMGYQAHCVVMEELSRASGTFNVSQS